MQTEKLRCISLWKQRRDVSLRLTQPHKCHFLVRVFNEHATSFLSRSTVLRELNLGSPPMSGSVEGGSDVAIWLLLWWWDIREARLVAEMFRWNRLCSLLSLGWLMHRRNRFSHVIQMRKISLFSVSRVNVVWLLVVLHYWPVFEEQGSEHIGSVFCSDLVWDYHLLHNLMSNTRQSLLVQVQQHCTCLFTPNNTSDTASSPILITFLIRNV